MGLRRRADDTSETSIMTMKFNKITQGMLEDYERQFFDVQGMNIGRGAVRYITANVQAAYDAGWIGEPFKGFEDKSWKDLPPSPERNKELRDTAQAIDAKYAEFTVIDPNG